MLTKYNQLPPGLLGELRKVIGRTPFTFEEAQSAYWSVPDERLSESELESIRNAVLNRDAQADCCINGAKSGGGRPRKSKIHAPRRRGFRCEQLDERIFPAAVAAFDLVETHTVHDTVGIPTAEIHEIQFCSEHSALHDVNAIDAKSSPTFMGVKVLDVSSVEAVFGVVSLAC